VPTLPGPENPDIIGTSHRQHPLPVLFIFPRICPYGLAVVIKSPISLLTNVQ
jgi:hypothetical protein